MVWRLREFISCAHGEAEVFRNQIQDDGQDQPQPYVVHADHAMARGSPPIQINHSEEKTRDFAQSRSGREWILGLIRPRRAHETRQAGTGVCTRGAP
jgi:hypothetical protein